MQEGVFMSCWINVKDRLPVPEGKSQITGSVFLETKQGIVLQAHYDYRYMQWFNTSGIIITNPLQWEEI